MCEPTHSIVQVDDPNNPPDDSDTGSPQATFSSSLLMSKLGSWAKKVKNWLHISKLGRGHSETVEARKVSVASYHYDMVFTLFEAEWWHRKVKLDHGGRMYFTPPQREARLAAATQYAENMSIGDLGRLRTFLEVSMQNSDRPYLYAEQFRRAFLTFEGRVKFEKEATTIFKKSLDNIFCDITVPKGKKAPTEKGRVALDSFIKFMLGFTRKRKLIVPEWADDEKLWVPKSKLITT